MTTAQDGGKVVSSYAPVAFTPQKILLVLFSVRGLDRSRGFQEVKVPRLHDNGTGW